MALSPRPALDRTSPTFKTDLDAYFLAALPALSTEANALQADVAAKQALASAAAVTAQAAIDAGLANAATNATTATTQAGIATTKASEANASAIAAAGSASSAASTSTATATAAATSAVATATASATASATTATTQAGIATTQAAAATAAAVGASKIVLGVSTLYPAIRPSLDLDFANSQTVDPRITFTRASTAARTNARGLIEIVPAGVPRIDFDAVTGACKGLLIEEQRTNLLLNSATLVTQNVTVSAVAHTLSFYGTGTVAMSGVATGSLVGAGAYPTRSTLTFTPTAGTLILTVTGSCTDGQIEAGAFPTSYIPTVASQVTRVADVASMTGVNFSSWYRQDEGTLTVDGLLVGGASGAFPYQVALVGANADTDSIGTYWQANAGTIRFGLRVGGSSQGDVSSAASKAANTPYKVAARYATNNMHAAFDGVLGTPDTTCTVPTVNALSIGGAVGYQNRANVWLRSIVYYPKALTNAELQAISTQ